LGKSVSVIGGGVAGLSASVFLAEKGFKVTLIEASPKFGGRAYSFFDKASGLKIDNGPAYSCKLV
jgi:phytoene dehydrogenase-like protein